MSGLDMMAAGVEERDEMSKYERAVEALRNARSCIIQHHDASPQPLVGGQYCPVCHLADGSEPMFEQIAAVLDESDICADQEKKRFAPPSRKFADVVNDLASREMGAKAEKGVCSFCELNVPDAVELKQLRHALNTIVVRVRRQKVDGAWCGGYAEAVLDACERRG